jgi:hypothetical protein
MMTRQERRQLRQIERAIYASDPHWARLISGGRPSAYERKRRVLNLWLDILASVLLLVGMLTGFLMLILPGIVVMFLAATLHMSRRRRATRPRLAG